MTLDKVLDKLAESYVYVSMNKVERAKTQCMALDYIHTITGSDTNRGATLRRVWFERVDYYRERERETHALNALSTADYKTKWWEGC